MTQEENCLFDAAPLATPEEIKNPRFVNLNYTNQDFWSMKTRLKQFIKERFENDFNDFIESQLAIMLIENWAFIADTLSFKIDQIANEPFIDTVTEVENAFRLAKLVGFKPTPPIASRAMFSATINNVLVTDLVIPRAISFDIVSEGEVSRYEIFPSDRNNNPLLEDDIVIPAGDTINTSIVGLEGTTHTDKFSGTGEVSQTLELTNIPVLSGSIRVDVDSTRWTEVDYFTDSQQRREYRVEFDSNYKAFVIFGNNRAGLIPSQGSVVQITYRSGGGTIGNVVTGFIETTRNFDVPGLNFTIPVHFRNYTKGEFGFNGDGIEDIRNKLPAYLRTQDRAVTGGDYKTLSEQFSTAHQGQIGKATAVLRNHGCAGNIVEIFVLAKSGETGLQEAGDILKNDLEEELDGKKMITDFICIKDGVIIEVDVTIDLTVDKFFKKFKEEIESNVNRRVDQFFAINNWDFGKDLKDSELIKFLSDVREVESYDINFITADPENSGNIVVAKYYEIIRPDTVTLTFTFE